eukprot:2581712-Heterocapsa_arctica.AAC.1
MGTTLSAWHSTHAPAHWALPCAGLWPKPRKVSMATSNAAWELSRCNECREVTACLRATKEIPSATEITVSADKHAIIYTEDEPAAEVTWDGAAAKFPSGRVAAAAATLWGPIDEFGNRPIIRYATVALPDVGWALSAEAWGLSL